MRFAERCRQAHTNVVAKFNAGPLEWCKRYRLTPPV